MGKPQRVESTLLRGDHAEVWHEYRRYTPAMARALVEGAGLRVERVHGLPRLGGGHQRSWCVGPEMNEPTRLGYSARVVTPVA